MLTAERIDALMPARPEWVAVAAAVDSREFAVAAFRAHFTDGLPMSEPANVDRALSLGVFGVPTVVVGDRLFWGDDRLEEAASAVGAPEHQAE